MNEPIKEKDNNDETNYKLLYSPRTTYSNILDEEDKLYFELLMSFDPITIKVLKKHFKERLGFLNKEEFIGILKNHLLSWNMTLVNRDEMLIKLLSRLFEEIDLNDNRTLEWNEFTHHIIEVTKSKGQDMTKYQLRLYEKSSKRLDLSEHKEGISQCFYIEKYHLMGIVAEGKSNIVFYDMIKCHKIKASIETKDILKEIDQLEMKELESKAHDLVIKEEKIKQKKLLTIKINQMKLKRKRTKELGALSSEGMIQTSLCNSERGGNIRKKKEHHDNNNGSLTPEKLRKELDRINYSCMASKQNKQRIKLSILATVFLSEYDILLVSTTNKKISAWKYYEGEFKNVNNSNNNDDYFRAKFNFCCPLMTSENAQYTMLWDDSTKILYTGQADGKILKWNMESANNINSETLDIYLARTKRNFDAVNNKETNDQSHKIISTNEKKDSVSSLIMIPKHKLVAAGYHNGHIILWDPLFKECRKYYNDQETSVYQMIFASIKNFLFTCGFSHDIYIYDTYIDNSAVYILNGHNASINNIALYEKESQLITFDINSTVKIWDLNEMANYQTLSMSDAIKSGKHNIFCNIAPINEKKKKISSNGRMVLMQNLNKILVYANNDVIIYERVKCMINDVADDNKILGTFYTHSSMEIVNICSRRIKFWNIFTGKIKKIYPNPMESDITSFALDKSKKKIYLGDINGVCKCFNLLSGSFLKEFNGHSREITLMKHSTTLGILITVSTNSCIKIHDDHELYETKVLNTFTVEDVRIQTILLVNTNKRIILGLNNGSIRFYNIEQCRFDSNLEQKKDLDAMNGPVLSMIAVTGTEMIFVAYESGLCLLMLIPPNPSKYQTMLSFINEIIDDDDESSPSLVYSLAYDDKNHLLYAGDYMGYLKCFNLGEVVDECLGKKIDDEIIDKIERKKINELWCVKAHKEAILELSFHDEIQPKIILTIGKDLKVKLISIDNQGEILEELKQQNSSYPPLPIAIEYYYKDLFNLNCHSNNEKDKKKKIIYKSDIESFSYKRRLKMEEQQKSDLYAKEIMDNTAKEKLFLLSKGISLKDSQSNQWNYQLSLPFIEQNLQSSFNTIQSLVQANEEIISQTENQMQKQSIYNPQYFPCFLETITPDKSQQMMEIITNKLRNINLAVVKSERSTINSSNDNFTEKNSLRRRLEKPKRHRKKNKSPENNNTQEKDREMSLPKISHHKMNSVFFNNTKVHSPNNKSLIKKGNRKTTMSSKLNSLSTAQLMKCKKTFDQRIEELDIPLKALRNKIPMALLLPKIKTIPNDLTTDCNDYYNENN